MALAALISAYQDADGPDATLRATLPLAGRTLVERQARLAAAVGASPVVILVERIPAELAAAIDRLRAEGVSALIARSAAEAAAAVPPDHRLLLIGDGLVADGGHFTRIAAAPAPALLTVPDQGVDDRHERIDADSRWAGLALLTGALLRDTVAMLQDWDLQSTLLRRAVQGGARQLAAKPTTADALLLIAGGAGQLGEAEQRIIASAGGPGRGWASRLLLAPLERLATRALMSSRLTPDWLHAGAVLFTAVAAFLLLRGWLWTGLALLLLLTPLDGIAERLAKVRLQADRATDWWRQLLPLAAGAALAALAHSLGRSAGWGCLVLAGATIAFLLALKVEMEGRDVAGRDWLAERKGMTWLMLPFAAAGFWVVGLGSLALYAASSFFWAQRQMHLQQSR